MKTIKSYIDCSWGEFVSGPRKQNIIIPFLIIVRELLFEYKLGNCKLLLSFIVSRLSACAMGPVCAKDTHLAFSILDVARWHADSK